MSEGCKDMGNGEVGSAEIGIGNAREGQIKHLSRHHRRDVAQCQCPLESLPVRDPHAKECVRERQWRILNEHS